jgi:hypothetical protein
MASLCEHSSAASDSIKGEEFVDWLSDCEFLKETLLHGVI